MLQYVGRICSSLPPLDNDIPIWWLPCQLFTEYTHSPCQETPLPECAIKCQLILWYTMWDHRLLFCSKASGHAPPSASTATATRPVAWEAFIPEPETGVHNKCLSLPLPLLWDLQESTLCLCISPVFCPRCCVTPSFISNYFSIFSITKLIWCYFWFKSPIEFISGNVLWGLLLSLYPISRVGSCCPEALWTHSGHYMLSDFLS